MAKAAIFLGAGEAHQPESVAIPQLEEGETLVQILCCALCRSDINTVLGRRVEPTPTILGHEIIGIVVASRGEARVGDRITWSIAASCGSCYYCLRGISQKCTSLFKYGHLALHSEGSLSGGLASHILLRKGTLILPIPNSLPDEVAVLANCSTATAAAAVKAISPREGDVVVVFGAGVLGITAAAMLAEFRCRAIVFDPNPVAAERAGRFGAFEFMATVEELHIAVSQHADGRGADASIELSGAPESAELAINIVRIGGKVVWAGTAAPVGKVAVDPEQIVRRLVTISGVHNYGPDDLAFALDFLTRFHEKYPFGALVSQRFSLDQVDEAFQIAAISPGSRILVVPN